MNEERALFSWLGRHPVVLGVVLGVLGILLVVVGVLGLSSADSEAASVRALRGDPANTVQATMVGSVTRVTETSGAGSRRTSYCPEYAYSALDGARHTIVDYGSCEASEKSLTIATIDVLVDPDHPAMAYIDERYAPDGGRPTIFSWVMLVAGVGLVAAAPFVAVRGVRKRAGMR